jgi:hypothetical protein
MSAVGLAQQDDEKLISVETLPPEPTVIMSGDLVRMTYRVRFPELLDQGQEIIVLEDRMTPETLAVHPFEAVSLEIEKRRVRDGHVWDLVYRLRLIHPSKSGYTIPGIAVYWLVRDLGEPIEDAEVQQVETDPAPVRYVTTITDLGPLDIRDTIDLGEYGTLAAAWTTIAWVVSPLPLFLWMLYVGRLSRRPRRASVKDRTTEELEQIEGQLSIPPPVRAARRQLRRRIRGLSELPPGEEGPAVLALERDLVISMRDYLHAELPELNQGDTPRDIKRYVETRVPAGGRQEALLVLASRLLVHQRRLEQGAFESIPDPAGEAHVLAGALDQLRTHVRMWRQVTDRLERRP